MPNTNPPTGTIEALRMKQKAAESSYVDYGIHGLLGDDTVGHLEELIDAGCTSFKAFVGNTFGNLPAPPMARCSKASRNWPRWAFVPWCTPRTRLFSPAARSACRTPVASTSWRI
ncbi:hypothetical protein ULF88_06465 [Halopseudomonas pachastrellae]|nr:hypothetical protein [Halopseudomonas pachastrellae]